jgi:hypothetical protein
MLHLPWIFSHVCIRKSNRKEVREMKGKPEKKEGIVKSNEAEKKDWQAVFDKAFEASCIAKSLYLALNSRAGEDLEDTEIDTLVKMVEDDLTEIHAISGEHLP